MCIQTLVLVSLHCLQHVRLLLHRSYAIVLDIMHRSTTAGLFVGMSHYTSGQAVQDRCSRPCDWQCLCTGLAEQQMSPSLLLL